MEHVRRDAFILVLASSRQAEIKGSSSAAVFNFLGKPLVVCAACQMSFAASQIVMTDEINPAVRAAASAPDMAGVRYVCSETCYESMPIWGRRVRCRGYCA